MQQVEPTPPTADTAHPSHLWGIVRRLWPYLLMVLWAVAGLAYTDLYPLRSVPFWQLTSEQDWDLCEKNQAGVSSSAFTPGPYSTKREYNVIRYIEWYLRQISGVGAA